MLAGLNQQIKRTAAYQQYRHSVVHVTLKEWGKALVRRLRLPKYRGSALCCPIWNANLGAFKPLSPSYERLTREHGCCPRSQVETFSETVFRRAAIASDSVLYMAHKR
jgi:hypothetical protein